MDETRDEMVNMILADSDAVCEACEADPRTAEDLAEWFMETVLASDGTTVARVRCPKCW